jgi:hypothetical protein
MCTRPLTKIEPIASIHRNKTKLKLILKNIYPTLMTSNQNILIIRVTIQYLYNVLT